MNRSSRNDGNGKSVFKDDLKQVLYFSMRLGMSFHWLPKMGIFTGPEGCLYDSQKEILLDD